MGLDIRFPIGFMFTLIGALLTLNGLATMSDKKMYEQSLGINVNLWWGLVLLVFGGLMLLFAWRAERATRARAKAEAAEKEAALKEH